MAMEALHRLSVFALEPQWSNAAHTELEQYEKIKTKKIALLISYFPECKALGYYQVG